MAVTHLRKIRMGVEGASCTCPIFLKTKVFKHSLGMRIRQKTVVVPATAKEIPIGQKRKRGRPRLATKALLVHNVFVPFAFDKIIYYSLNAP